ncbi:MtnX-like HAD-IB family phosphatase [Pseudalkalibacillus hwajinpoensis]|uniref:2,3-diketo-5-methylthio-1-phosphopentane phosphatase n=1 Tax=Guptibacillus hwajinpoensis TaxID=208199 RepID=A0A4V5Q1R8_9BACL|nr:MtnX-like HAD-IB family phosphatase [Pseudalkalibacillus hwajinpoensis]TKD71378.1 2,3-diketo-5-methylthio-1-phosphopentane phosphatase [Pseudalkalibacillus hwajinpoensis]
MGNWAFVSDFDGTISKKDFYWLVIETYFPEGQELYKKWKAGEYQDIDFLQKVFKSIDQNEDQIIKDIRSLPIDEHVPSFIKTVQQSGGDFYILSAGTDYYIEHILLHYGIDNVPVFSNKGYYENQNVHLSIDENHKHYSRRYGIDKSKVIEEMKEKYDFVYFAGDSEPDSHPAKVADLTFAKDALQDILKENGVPFIGVNSFKEIEKIFRNKGILS